MDEKLLEMTLADVKKILQYIQKKSSRQDFGCDSGVFF